MEASKNLSSHSSTPWGALTQGQQIHADILTAKASLDDAFMGTKLVFMHGKCGMLSDAWLVFDEMPSRSVLLGLTTSTSSLPHFGLSVSENESDLSLPPGETRKRE